MKPESEFRIVFDQAGGGEAQFVRDHLDFFNVGVTGESAYYPVHLFLKNERGEVMGGLLGSIWGGWLHITYLWIDEAVRGKRWATKLMDQAEGKLLFHHRPEANDVLLSIQETLKIGRDVNVPVVISHHKCSMPENFGRSVERTQSHLTLGQNREQWAPHHRAARPAGPRATSSRRRRCRDSAR